VIGAWVHIGMGHTEALAYVGSDPVGGVFHAHRHSIGFVLAWAWHIQVLRTHVELHAKSKLGLLLSDGISFFRFSWVREVKVAWNVVMRTWDAHLLVILIAFFLGVTNHFVDFTELFDSRSLSNLGGHSERRALHSMCNIKW